MPITDLFFKRQARLRGEVPDVYQYDDIPQRVRVQIVHVMVDCLGQVDGYTAGYGYNDPVTAAYEDIINPLRRELGVFDLPNPAKRSRRTLTEELADFLLTESDTEKWLSAVELICSVILTHTAEYRYKNDPDAAESALSAIDEINGRFKEGGLGYEYDRQIIRIDTEYLHSESVRPALEVLRDSRFRGANDEFRSAHAHFRQGKNKEALVDALKSLESTMKTICMKRKWTHHPTDNAKKLISTCFQNGLIPEYWRTHFSSLQQMLESSVPTARNKDSAHGQGVDIKIVPDYLAAYVLHMTASTIVFLAAADHKMP